MFIRCQAIEPEVAVRAMAPDQDESLAAALGRAHQEQPGFAYMIPDARSRRSILPWFFRSAIHLAELYGAIYTTPSARGGAVWIRPEHDLTLGRIAAMGMTAMSSTMEWGIAARAAVLGRQLEEVRRRLAPAPCWYLLALGVEPDPDQDRAAMLLEPVLHRADQGGTPCYVETFDESRLCFYRRQGFEIAGAGAVPGGGPAFWVMIRRPRPPGGPGILDRI